MDFPSQVPLLFIDVDYTIAWGFITSHLSYISSLKNTTFKREDASDCIHVPSAPSSSLPSPHHWECVSPSILLLHTTASPDACTVTSHSHHHHLSKHEWRRTTSTAQQKHMSLVSTLSGPKWWWQARWDQINLPFHGFTQSCFEERVGGLTLQVLHTKPLWSLYCEDCCSVS